MNDLLSLTWESLSQPVPLALIVVLLMQLFGKKLIDLLIGLLPEDCREKFRSLAINGITWGICYLIAALHKGIQFSAGDAFVVSLQAVALSTSMYQGVKSIAKAFGRNGP